MTVFEPMGVVRQGTFEALRRYGGSSALTVMLALGLVMKVSVRRFA